MTDYAEGERTHEETLAHALDAVRVADAAVADALGAYEHDQTDEAHAEVTRQRSIAARAGDDAAIASRLLERVRRERARAELAAEETAFIDDCRAGSAETFVFETREEDAEIVRMEARLSEIVRDKIERIAKKNDRALSAQRRAAKLGPNHIAPAVWTVSDARLITLRRIARARTDAGRGRERVEIVNGWIAAPAPARVYGAASPVEASADAELGAVDALLEAVEKGLRSKQNE